MGCGEVGRGEKRLEGKGMGRVRDVGRLLVSVEKLSRSHCGMWGSCLSQLRNFLDWTVHC